MDGLVNGWSHVKSLKSNKSRPSRDNSIMDILDIFLDILLKPPQPLMGLFFLVYRWFQVHTLNYLIVSSLADLGGEGCAPPPGINPGYTTDGDC